MNPLNMNTKPVIAIDPGPEVSGVVVWDGTIATGQQNPNDILRGWVESHAKLNCGVEFRIEGIASYGMPVGAETFNTCYMIGRLIEICDRYNATWKLILRRDVKLFWCGNARAKDSNIRQAILDRFGGKEKAIGKKAAPGPLYGIKGHCWSALALALIE